MRRCAPAFRHYFGSSAEPDAVRWESHQFVRPRRLAGGRGVHGFPDSLGRSSPVRILSGTCRSSRRTLIFPLRTRLAKFTIVSEQFKNSSFTCGHSSPLSPDSLFSIPQRRAAKRNGYEGQKKARAVRCCLPVFAVSVSLGPPSTWERGTIESPTTATESRGSRAILACSPESFRNPYFVNEPQTRGAAARPNTGGKTLSTF